MRKTSGSKRGEEQVPDEGTLPRLPWKVMTEVDPCREQLHHLTREPSAHLPQTEEHPRVVPACDLVQEVVHQLLAVAPGILHKLLQAGGAARAGWDLRSSPSCPGRPPPRSRWGGCGVDHTQSNPKTRKIKAKQSKERGICTPKSLTLTFMRALMSVLGSETQGD